MRVSECMYMCYKKGKIFRMYHSNVSVSFKYVSFKSISFKSISFKSISHSIESKFCLFCLAWNFIWSRGSGLRFAMLSRSVSLLSRYRNRELIDGGVIGMVTLSVLLLL